MLCACQVHADANQFFECFIMDPTFHSHIMAYLFLVELPPELFLLAKKSCEPFVDSPFVSSIFLCRNDSDLAMSKHFAFFNVQIVRTNI